MCFCIHHIFSVLVSNPTQSINVSVLVSSNLALCFMYSALEHIFLMDLALYNTKNNDNNNNGDNTVYLMFQ